MAGENISRVASYCRQPLTTVPLAYCHQTNVSETSRREGVNDRALLVDGVEISPPPPPLPKYSSRATTCTSQKLQL